MTTRSMTTEADRVIKQLKEEKKRLLEERERLLEERQRLLADDEEEEKCNTCGKNIDDDDDDKKCGEGCPEYDEGWKETHPEEEEEVIYYFLKDYELTQTDTPFNPKIHEWESLTKVIRGRIEQTYKLKGTDEGGNCDEEEKEKCDCGEELLICDSGIKLCSKGCKDYWVYSNGEKVEEEEEEE